MSKEISSEMATARKELATATSNLVDMIKRLQEIIESQREKPITPDDMFVEYHRFWMATERFEKLTRGFIDSWA